MVQTPRSDTLVQVFSQPEGSGAERGVTVVFLFYFQKLHKLLPRVMMLEMLHWCPEWKVKMRHDMKWNFHCYRSNQSLQQGFVFRSMTRNIIPGGTLGPLTPSSYHYPW